MFSFTRQFLIALAVVFMIGGCASPPPAPIEQRTRPPKNDNASAKAPVQSSSPAPVRRAQPPAKPVKAAPVPNRTVQVRPLGSVVAREQQSAPANLRDEPRGEKLPYSDKALAELRSSPSPAPAAPPESVATAPKPGASSGSGAASPPAIKPGSAATGSAFSWPAFGPVIKSFSEPSYTGISIAGNPGDPITAAADGKVIFSGVGPRGYGNLIIVRHDPDTLSVYAHNRSLLVKDGDQVQRGQKIAELGDTGADRPKLHFEIRKAGKPVDPKKLLPLR